MTVLWMVIALVLKRVIFSNLIDVGYSESRTLRYGHWKVAFVKQVVVEEFGSAVLFLIVGLPAYWPVFFTMETIAQLTTCLVERKASYRKMLRYHLFCEFGIFFFYLMYFVLTTIMQ